MPIIKTSLIDAVNIVTGTLVAGVISTTNITTGKLNVTTGATIGGFKVEGDTLSSLNQNGAILIEENGVHFLRINEYGMRLPEAPLLTIRNDKGAAISLSGGNNKNVLSILGNGAKNAIESTGSHIFNQRDGETWSAPGVLWAGLLDSNGNINFQWGNGCKVGRVYRHGPGDYVIEHDAKGIYTPFATAIHGNWSVASISDINANYFHVRTFHKDSNYMDSWVSVMIVGRPTLK